MKRDEHVRTWKENQGSLIDYLDIRLRWKEHIKKKRRELDLKHKKMYWLLGRKSQLSVHNELLLHKQVLKPMWTYDIQLWGWAATSNMDKIQIFQNKVLRGIADAPWYYSNDHLHRDVSEEYRHRTTQSQSVRGMR
jgi:hypothetical protein